MNSLRRGSCFRQNSACMTCAVMIARIVLTRSVLSRSPVLCIRRFLGSNPGRHADFSQNSTWAPGNLRSSVFGLYSNPSCRGCQSWFVVPITPDCGGWQIVFVFQFCPCWIPSLATIACPCSGDCFFSPWPLGLPFKQVKTNDAIQPCGHGPLWKKVGSTSRAFLHDMDRT